MDKMDLLSLFTKHIIEESREMTLRIGMVEISYSKLSDSWLFQSKELKNLVDNFEVISSTELIDTNSAQLIQSGKGNVLRIAPALPAKPVVFKNSKINILPGQSLKLYLVIPISLQFYRDHVNENNLLCEFPTRRLSDTWFGESDSGEAAFSIGTNFYQKFEMIQPAPNEAICPVKISNNSSTILEVQRLIIRVNELNLYESHKKIITSQVDIEFKGKDQVSSVSYKIDKSLIKDKVKTLANPRNPASSMLKLNFHFIKNIYQ